MAHERKSVLVAMALAAMGGVPPVVMPVQVVEETLDEDLEALIDAANAEDTDQLMGVHHVGANVGSKVEEFVSLHRIPSSM